MSGALHEICRQLGIEVGDERVVWAVTCPFDPKHPHEAWVVKPSGAFVCARCRTEMSASELAHVVLGFVDKADAEEWVAYTFSENGAEPWPPLPSQGALPPFPVEALPTVVSEWVKATAEATQTPIDLAACSALGVLSACVAGAVQVEVAPGWREEVCLYIVCALESGERKSAVLRGATAPLREVERERMEQARPEVARARAEREVAEQRRRRLMAEAAKKNDPALTSEVAELSARLARQDESHVPRLLADDATPEALGGLLARHGRIAVLAAESAFLDNLAGRYAEGRANLHLVCQAYSGEPTTIDRRSREPETLDRPLLTMALCVQPHVLAALVADPISREQGFVARCLVCRPGTLLGRRKTDALPVPEATSGRWAGLVKRLAELPESVAKSAKTDLGEPGTAVNALYAKGLGLSPAAFELLAKRRTEHEPLLGEDGDLRPIASWQARHAGRVARLAALLHLTGDEPSDEIGEATMKRALAIGEWSLAHALDALAGPDTELRRALAWLRRNGEPEVSTTDLRRALRLMADAAEALAGRLEAHGALLPIGERGGRPPSPRFAVHPDLRSVPGSGRGAERREGAMT
jgi:replicative DNA helicase